MTKLKIGILCAVLALIMVGCEKEEVEESTYHMYYINKEETKVVSEGYTPKSAEASDLVEEFLSKLEENPENTDYKKAKPDEVKLQGYSIEASQVYLTFNEGYYKMSSVAEILFRTAMVRMLTQIPGIEFVSFYINDQPLTDANDNVVGIMTAANFIENTGDEINSYERTNLTLYYANEAGNKLIETSVDVVYSTNISTEKLVIEQLIQGPTSDQVYPTLPPETKLLSVSTSDGVCYVNFDESFLNHSYELTESVPVYSVVNSLLELSGITRVQILINGETDITYREAINFNTLFERNLDIIENNSIVTEGKEDIIDE
ncbi:GerMN domain-containing protein [Konateibacter massiliensis]|uniref:GerMN domain-containing protein n=1 Tax=Konateibacter massiliensis TaxID=2002841 RepID=UPI0015D4CFF0|nr:GerMN domain-containing protein [Konateibacter massiliensis]